MEQPSMREQHFSADADSLRADCKRLARAAHSLLKALGSLVSKPAPFCVESGRAVCPYCDSTEHPDNCEWLQAQQIWVGIKNQIFAAKNQRKEKAK